MRPDNTSKETAMLYRRQRVAELRLMGASQRDIWKVLAEGGPNGAGKLINPATGQPYSLGTINGDIQALEAEWRANAAQSTDVHQARQLAEIQKIKIQAFSQKNPDLALKAISLEMKLLGTAAPQKIDLGLPVDKLMTFLDAVRKLGHEPESFVDRTIHRAQLIQ